MSTPEINKTTANAATEENQLALGSLRLLGVVTRPDSSKALLRAPDGRTMMVSTGETTPFGQIQAIGEAHVIVNTGVRTRRLALPA